MTHGKDEGKESASETDLQQTPFGRLAEFVRRVVAVPRAELEKKERDYQRRKKRRGHTQNLTE